MRPWAQLIQGVLAVLDADPQLTAALEGGKVRKAVDDSDLKIPTVMYSLVYDRPADFEVEHPIEVDFIVFGRSLDEVQTLQGHIARLLDHKHRLTSFAGLSCWCTLTSSRDMQDPEDGVEHFIDTYLFKIVRIYGSST
jgi:hypothetical protein